MAKKKVNVVAEVKKEMVPVVLPANGGSLDLKNILEIMDGLDLIINGMNKVLEDGKIDWSDSLIFIEIVKEYKVFIDAAKDSDVALLELKDLDQVEMISLVSRVFNSAKLIKAMVMLIKNMK